MSSTFADVTGTTLASPSVGVRRSRSDALSTSVTAGFLLAILVVAAGLRVVVFHGLWGADDAEYARLANAMAHGNYWAFVDENYVRQFTGPAHLPYRVGLIAPLAALFRVFGVSEMTLVAYPLLISILGVVVAFVAGRMFFGTRAGLIAAGLWAVVPVDVKYATSFLPDGVASFYASLAVLTLVAFSRREEASPKTLFAAGAGAGLLFGISWLSKESITYLVPFCGVLIVLGLWSNPRRTIPLWMGVAVAAGGVLVAEMGYYAVARGDFMLRMHENERSFQQTRSYLFYEGSRFGWPVGGSRATALVKRLFLTGPSILFADSRFLFLPLFGLLAAARAFVWKDKAFTIPAIWMLSLIAMFNFASPSFASYTPLVLLHRYLLPMVLPAVLLTAGLVDRLLARDPAAAPAVRRERLFWGSAVAASLVVICGYYTFREVRGHAGIRPMYETRDVSAFVRPSDRVYTDPMTHKVLEFYWAYPAATRLVDFEGMQADAITPGSFVLVDTNRLKWLDVNVSMWLTEDYGYHAPAFAGRPPESWQPIWRNQYTTLYRVN